jgi:hypothetical protein
MLQGMFGGLIETGRCYGMETNVRKTKVIPNAIIPITDFYISETTGECGIFQLFG